MCVGRGVGDDLDETVFGHWSEAATTSCDSVTWTVTASLARPAFSAALACAKREQTFSSCLWFAASYYRK